MNALYKNIKKYRELRSLSQEELAVRTGYTDRTSISKIESGLVDLSQSKIIQFAEALGVSVGELWGLDTVPLPIKTTKIPILGSVPAGVPIEAVENILGTVEIDEKLTFSGKYFALRIQGESMIPEIKDGDVVIVREQEDVENGEIAIVYVNGYDATCKKITQGKTGIILQPLNPAYEVQSFDWDETNEIPVKIIGKVVEIRRFL